MKRLIPAVLTVCLAAGCAPQGPAAMARIPGLEGASEVYTLTNLHPDDPRPVLYATNYQRAGLLPVCTRVTIERLTTNAMTFRIADTRKLYKYKYHKSAIEPLASHLRRYFGPHCPKDEIAKMSEIDRRGVEAGTVSIGMSKWGVVYAIGYPPPSSTPNLELNSWLYWRNRFASSPVEFGPNGKVTSPGYQRKKGLPPDSQPLE